MTKYYITISPSLENLIYVRRDKIINTGYDEYRETHFVNVRFPGSPSGTWTLWAHDVSCIDEDISRLEPQFAPRPGINWVFTFETVGGEQVNIRRNDVIWIKTDRAGSSELEIAYIQDGSVKKILTLDYDQVGKLIMEKLPDISGRK